MASFYHLVVIKSPASLGITVFSLVITYFISKVFYNLFFHPISKYPGPKLFAASGLPNFFHVLTATRAYKVSALHNKYGPIVRIGPNELSYISEEAWRGIYSSHKASGGIELQKYMPPSPNGFYGIFQNPSDADHSRIRKILSPGFSEKAIREKEDIIQGYITLLIQTLQKGAGKPVDILSLFDCVGADVSGRLAFGQDFRAIETSQVPEVIRVADMLLKRLARTQAMNQYFLTRNFNKFMGWHNQRITGFFRVFVSRMLKKRQAQVVAGIGEGKPPDDHISLLTQNFMTPKGLSEAELGVVSGDLMIAGGDTVATSLSGAIYHLLCNPTKLKILTQEIRTAFLSESEIDLTSVNSLRYQNAVISEALRLFPAAPETVRRITVPGGNVICGDMVPGGTIVGVYHWAAGHYKHAWKDADSFIPERWLGDKAYENDSRGVVQVFNIGPRNCIGQNLAMALMRLILARIIWNFEIQLNDESKNWLDMGAYTLVYDKRPLMVQVKLVER